MPEVCNERRMPEPVFRRFAIYYIPPPGPLARFGAEWLGWDIAAGAPAARRADIPGLPAPLDALTEAPRRYGFHATIKPPFRLAPGQTEAALTATLREVCAARAPVTTAGLEIASLGRFLALTPRGDTSALTALAADIVRALDLFRATPTAAETARHQRATLSAAQTENVRLWGNPHVMDSFRWHMTLTGKRPRAEAEQTRAALAPMLAPLLRPLRIDALSLVGEDATGHFHQIHSAPLRD